MSMTRITITIPADLVEAADRRAGELDRSRSWVLVDALEAYLEGPQRVVREAAPPYASGLGPSRVAQLEADLALTPEERVALAEETALVSRPSRRRAPRGQVLVFDRLEEFHAWERQEALDD
jgi:hypothetical protein